MLQKQSRSDQQSEVSLQPFSNMGGNEKWAYNGKRKLKQTKSDILPKRNIGTVHATAGWNK